MDLASPDYVFMAKSSNDVDINYELDEVKLLVPCIRSNDKVFLDLEHRLSENVMRQYFDKVELFNFSMSKGARKEVIDTISFGRAPSRLYVLFLETSRSERF